jgi:hypothetical protein
MTSEQTPAGPAGEFEDFIADLEVRITARGELYESDEECLETIRALICKRLSVGFTPVVTEELVQAGGLAIDDVAVCDEPFTAARAALTAALPHAKTEAQVEDALLGRLIAEADRQADEANLSGMTDLSHIRELLAKATPEEWYSSQDDVWAGNPDPEFADIVAENIGGLGDEDRANAALITALRNNAEAMLDRIDELEARNVYLAGQAMCEGERANEAEAERDAMLERIEELEAGLRRIDIGLTKAIDMDNALSLDDMATQVRDLSRELVDSKAS